MESETVKGKVKLPIVSQADGNPQVVEMALDIEAISKKHIRPYTINDPGGGKAKESPNRCVMFDNMNGKESNVFIVGMAQADLIKKLEGLKIIKMVS